MEIVTARIIITSYPGLISIAQAVYKRLPPIGKVGSELRNGETLIVKDIAECEFRNVEALISLIYCRFGIGGSGFGSTDCTDLLRVWDWGVRILESLISLIN